MEYNTKVLNIVTIVYLFVYLFFFSFIDQELYYLVYSDIPTMILFDYIPILLLLANVVLIILLMTKKNKKKKKYVLTKWNIAILVIFGLTIIFTPPFMHLLDTDTYEEIDVSDPEDSYWYTPNNYNFSKFFVSREYYMDEDGEIKDDDSNRYFYIPIVNKLVIVEETTDGIFFRKYDVKYRNGKVILYDGEVSSSYYKDIIYIK